MKKKTSARQLARAKRSAKQATSKPDIEKALASLPVPGTYCPDEAGHFSGVLRSEDGKHVFVEYVLDQKHWPTAAWGALGRIAGADSEYDGLANTQAMAAAGNALAKKVLAMKVDGLGDIHIAAPRQARLAFVNGCLPKIGYAWTSCQYRYWANTAWAQYCSDGNQDVYLISTKLPVVLVRRKMIR